MTDVGILSSGIQESYKWGVNQKECRLLNTPYICELMC